MPGAGTGIDAFFLESPRGPLFCLYRAPAVATTKDCLLYLHPFAEEMHKSRRMAAMQARALAENGHAVLQVDLTGCGDSAGDFGDAAWSGWLDDARLAHTWLRKKTGRSAALWGLRTGALLAAELACQLPDVPRLLLWQPVADGSLFLNQFLRIKLASEMLTDGQSRSGTRELLAQLDAGQGIEVGGYLLSPAMAQELGRRKLSALIPPCPVSWLETGASQHGSLSPASQRMVDGWRRAGVPIEARPVACDPFWATQEISECPALIGETLACLVGSRQT